MKKTLLAASLVVLLTGCASWLTPAQQASLTAEGQLFCQVQKADGPLVVGLITAAAPTVNGPAAPSVILATNATAAVVRQACDLAAQNVGGVAGIPVSPPTTVVGNVAVVPPAGIAVVPPGTPLPTVTPVVTAPKAS